MCNVFYGLGHLIFCCLYIKDRFNKAFADYYGTKIGKYCWEESDADFNSNKAVLVRFIQQDKEAVETLQRKKLLKNTTNPDP